MQYSSLFVAAATLALAQAAKFTNPTFATVTAGQPFNISWTDATGPVTIVLKNGASTNLKDVETIAAGQSGTSFSWTPSNSLPADTYALEIKDSGPPNYSTQFELIGATGSPSSSGSSSGSVSSTASGNSTTSSSSPTSSPTSSSNTTTTRSSSGSNSTPSPTRSGSSNTGSSSGTSVPDANSASGLASNLALVLLGFAAIMTLN